MVNMNLAIRIASWRTAKGLSQRQLATILDVSPSAVSLWEKGGELRVKNIEALAKTFGISVQKLCFGPKPKAG